MINLSLGGEDEAPVLRDAIQYAVSAGAFVAISAGNGGEDGNPVEYPAAYGAEINGAMAVGAVNTRPSARGVLDVPRLRGDLRARRGSSRTSSTSSRESRR